MYSPTEPFFHLSMNIFSNSSALGSTVEKQLSWLIICFLLHIPALKIIIHPCITCIVTIQISVSQCFSELPNSGFNGLLHF